MGSHPRYCGASWVFPISVRGSTLLAWLLLLCERRCRKVLTDVRLCIFGQFGKKKNRIMFDNGVWPVYKMKSSFISNFWLWSNLWIDNRTNSLLDFFDLDGL